MRLRPEQIPSTMHFLTIDFPVLILQTGGVEDTDEYWQQYVEKMNIVAGKYEKNDLARELLLTYDRHLTKFANKAKELKREKEEKEK
jgi:hypothetical protein